MSRSFLVPLNLNQNEIQNVRLQNLSSKPSSPVIGQAIYDTTVNAVFVWNGTAWANLDATKLVGAIPIAAIASFASTVLGYRLDQFATPTADIDMGGRKLTGLADPVAGTDACSMDWTMAQVNAAAAGVASKAPCRLVTTGNVSLSGLAAVDGVTPIAGDRILVTAQTVDTGNGVYTAASGVWTRSATVGELEEGSLWLVTQGVVNAGTQWVCATSGTITPGSTSIDINQFDMPTVYSAGVGLDLTTNTFSVNPKVAGGLIADGTGLYIDTSFITRKYSVTVGDSVASTFAINHNLGSTDVAVQVHQTASPFGVVEADIALTSTTVAQVTFAAPPATSAYRVVCVG